MNLDQILARNLPDPLLRLAVRMILRARIKNQAIESVEQRQVFKEEFVKSLKKGPIAIHTADANVQHYELPPEFFKVVLGKMMKYSCGYWPEEVEVSKAAERLDQSEEEMLKLTCRRAKLCEGQKILDLGCGWGSMALYLARIYPSSEIMAVSNSADQINYIRRKTEEESLGNLSAMKADINDLALPSKFDRVVSVEMFEHMRNYEALLEKVAGFLKPKGKLFIHIFSHHTYPFLYEDRSGRDWMARHFFSGGTMPSQDLFHYFQNSFALEKQWALSGNHYRLTLEAWLKKMDRQKAQIMPLFKATYGPEEAEKWWNYWRLFFLACAEFFAFNNGNEWFISHYRFTRR